MTSSLADFLKENPELYIKAIATIGRNRAELLGMLENMGAEYTHGRAVAFIDSKLVDVINNTEEKISCSSGCSHCCYYHVDITAVEAKILSQYVTEDMIPKLKAQAAKGNASWLTLEHSQRRCVFLADDNKCSVYNKRPISCRKYHVVSDPNLCSVEQAAQGVQAAVSMPAELFASATFEVMGWGSMPDMLLLNLNKL